MPVSLAQLATNTASITLPVGDDVVIVEYYPGRFTERAIATMNAMSALDESQLAAGFAAFNQELANLIKSWDVLENDGVTMFPIDPERFSELPLGFRMQVIGAIMGDLSPEAIAPQVAAKNGSH